METITEFVNLTDIATEECIHVALAFDCYGEDGDTLDMAIQELVNQAKQPYTHLLVIQMPCGNVLSCKTGDDIPRQDTPCPCGNPNHWLVKVKGCL